VDFARPWRWVLAYAAMTKEAACSGDTELCELAAHGDEAAAGGERMSDREESHGRYSTAVLPPVLGDYS
jgi:hypothetical protein